MATLGDRARARAVVSEPRAESNAGRRAMALVLPPLVVFLFFIALWQLVSSTVFGGESYILPGPAAVAATAVQEHALLLAATGVTLLESAAGFVIAIILGVAAAVLLSQSKVLERSLYPYAILLQTVPIIAIAPIIVLWFGYNTLSVIVISVLIALFPIINNTLLGLLSTPRNQLDLFALHHAGRVAEFGKLRFPSAVPNLVAGLRISAGLSVIGALVGEFIIGAGGSQGGLGVQVIFAEGQLRTALMFAEVLAATCLGVAFFLVVSFGGHMFLRTWHESAISSER